MLLSRAQRSSVRLAPQSSVRFASFPSLNEGKTGWERAWKPKPPQGFKYDPKKPQEKAFGRLHNPAQIPCYALESHEHFDTIDQSRYKPQGRLETRKEQLAYGWWPRKPEDKDLPDDVSLMWPYARSGQYVTPGPYDPKAWVENGGPLGLNIRGWAENYAGRPSRWQHAHYEKAQENKLTRHGEDATGFRHMHLRPNERKTAFQKWFHRKLDERWIDLGSKHFWTVFNIHLPQTIMFTVAIIGGLVGHFGADELPQDPMPVGDYLMRMQDEQREIDPRRTA